MYDRKTGEKIHDEQYLIDINKKVVELGELLNKPVVATCDVHHLNDDEKIYRQIMLTVSGFKDIERTPSLYLLLPMKCWKNLNTWAKRKPMKW